MSLSRGITKILNPTVIIPLIFSKASPFSSLPLSQRFNTKNKDIRYALPKSYKSLDEFDISEYNEIKLRKGEKARIISEALTWDSDKRNELRASTLSNGKTYLYVIDNESNVHIYAAFLVQTFTKKGIFMVTQTEKNLIKLLKCFGLDKETTVSVSVLARTDEIREQLIQETIARYFDKGAVTDQDVLKLLLMLLKESSTDTFPTTKKEI